MSAIRPSTPADGPAIGRLLLDAGLHPNAEPRELHWKYWQKRADWPGPRSYVLTRGDEIIAHAGIVPGVCVMEGRRLQLMHLIDWAARADAAGAGVSLMKHVGRLADGLFAIGGSAQTLRILPHIGFRPCGTATVYVRALHPLRILRSAGGSRWNRWLRIVRSAAWRATAPATVPEGWHVHRIERDQTDSLMSLLPRAHAGTGMLGRSTQLFEHMLKCPIASMSLYKVTHDGVPRGYFLLASAPGQVRLADGWVDTDAPADRGALIRCAAREALRNEDAAELVAWASDDASRHVLRTCGFHARGALPVQIMLPRSAGAVPRALNVQMLDNDAAFYRDRDAMLCA